MIYISSILNIDRLIKKVINHGGTPPSNLGNLSSPPFSKGGIGAYEGNENSCQRKSYRSEDDGFFSISRGAHVSCNMRPVDFAIFMGERR